MTEQILPSDGQLLAEYLDSGVQRPFEQLVRRHAALVLGVCRGVLREPGDAEDAAQAAFLTLARKAPSLRGQPTVAGWLHRVAWHVSMRAREARRLRQHREREAAAFVERARPSDDARETAGLVHEQLARLPEKYRVPLILHHLEGWGEQEVAQMLGCKLGTISGRLSRARQMLKERLESRGVRGAAATGAILALAVAPATEALAAELARGAATPTAHAQALSGGALHMLARAQRRLLVLAGAVVVLVGLAGFWLVTRPDANPAPAAVTVPTHGSVSGVVVGPSGGPVRGATVRAWTDREAARRNEPVARTTTAADGSFLLPDVPAGPKRFVLCFIQQPFMHARVDLDVNGGEETSAGRLVLQAGRYED